MSQVWKNVRIWRLTLAVNPNILAHIHSAWNYQKRFTVNGSRGGFSTDQWLCCSRLGANVQVSGQKVPTFLRVIYQFVPAGTGPGAHPSFMKGEHPSLTERSPDWAVLHVPPTPEHWARSSGSWGLSGSVQRDSTGQGEPARLVDHVADSGSHLAVPSRHWKPPVSAGRSPRHSSGP